jgi:hypothetical protein
MFPPRVLGPEGYYHSGERNAEDFLLTGNSERTLACISDPPEAEVHPEPKQE